LAAEIAAARAAQGGEGAFTVVANKIDLVPRMPGIAGEAGVPVVYVSALTGAGIPLLVEHVKELAGLGAESPGALSARRRHLDALERTNGHLVAARSLLTGALELTAEHLRQAQTSLSELTGEVTSDDLLGEIFATFCIGK
ncbi:MAG TPA: tRNA uridine-5-carboxymethylaminomethyl(34) synthesis GTPase MnmE, partial [Gammaproteobacteria bacterium]|nr:tRNA uridine-5-carboxymethylaminomethyl(34) synthesis GTPase MnmE [Gammaproteobacteria bacterium]